MMKSGVCVCVCVVLCVHKDALVGNVRTQTHTPASTQIHTQKNYDAKIAIPARMMITTSHTK